MSKRIDPKFTEHLFRPVFEINTAAMWAVGAVATPFTSAIGTSVTSFSIPLSIAGGMVGVSSYYTAKALPLLKKQLALTINKKEFITTKELRDKNLVEKRFTGKLKRDPRQVYMGKGYIWGSEHAQRAYQVLDMDSTLSDVQLPFFLKPIKKILSRETEELGGAPWIHGMGDQKPISVIENTLFGHTFIGGNVGTGKTTLLRLMSVNALHMGNVLVVLDPKNDDDWKSSIKKEMDYLGIGDQFYHIHPSQPNKSARIALLNNYTRITEIANRIAPLMGGQGAGKSFQDFAYGILVHTARALRYLNEPIRLTTIQKVIASDRRGLAMRVISRYYEETLGAGWQGRLTSILDKINSADRLSAMAFYYQDVLSKDNPEKAVEGMIEFGLHDEGHYSKMVVSLRPVLTALTAEPLDDLLSVIDTDDYEDTRPIVDLAAVMDKGGCIYVSLDSLSDAQSAGFIARLITAELAAVAGDRYNNIDLKSARRVTIANDEVHASIENNDSLLNLAAQGRAALIQMILATQTVSDLEAKTDAATARRFLGLCNNFICMRTTDPATQEYVSEQFSTTSISQSQAQVASGSSTNTSILEFSSTYGERLMKTREDMFPKELLGQLPILQYVARLADGRRLKMKLDVLINTDKEGEQAPWVQ